MKKKSLLVLMFVSIITVSASLTQAEDNKVNYISAIAANMKFKKSNAILIDAMPERDFERFHALGSINLPNDGPADIQKLRNMELPFTKDDELLVYCS